MGRSSATRTVAAAVSRSSFLIEPSLSERNAPAQPQQASHVDLRWPEKRWTDGGHGASDGAAVENIKQVDDGFQPHALMNTKYTRKAQVEKILPRIPERS